MVEKVFASWLLHSLCDSGQLPGLSELPERLLSVKGE